MGIELVNFIDPVLLVSLVFLLNQRKIGTPKLARKISSTLNNSVLLPISALLAAFWIISLRNLNPDTSLGKAIALFQNFYPNKTPFLDGKAYSQQFACSQHLDLFKDSSCIGAKWNYPPLFKFLPAFLSNFEWAFISLVFLCWALIFVIIYTKTKVFGKFEIAMMFSFATVFSLERGNIEPISALLLFSTALLASKIHSVHKASSVLTYTVLTSMSAFIFINSKYFGAFLPIILILFSKYRWEKIYWTIFSVFGLAWTFGPLQILTGLPNAPRPSVQSLGLFSLLHNFGSLSVFQAIFDALLIVAFSKYIFISAKRFYKLGKEIQSIENLKVLLPIPLLFGICWVLTSNVFYRALLVTPFLLITYRKINSKLLLAAAFVINYLSTFPITTNMFCILLLVLVAGFFDNQFKNKLPNLFLFAKNVPQVK